MTGASVWSKSSSLDALAFILVCNLTNFATTLGTCEELDDDERDDKRVGVMPNFKGWADLCGVCSCLCERSDRDAGVIGIVLVYGCTLTQRLTITDTVGA